MIDLKLPSVGHVAIGGHDSQGQAYVVRDLAGQCLAAGGSVVSLHDYATEGQQADGAMADWLRANSIGLEAMDRFSTIDNVRLHRTAEDLQNFIEKKKSRVQHKPVLIVRDLSRGLALQPGAHWLSVADGLALAMDCVVLTAFGVGPAPTPLPNWDQFQHVDELWVCTEGLSLRLTLKRVTPSDVTVLIKGAVGAFEQLILSNAEQPEGFSHVA